MKKYVFIFIMLLLSFFMYACEKHNCADFKSDWQIVNDVLCGEEYTEQIICSKCELVLDTRTSIKEHDYEANVESVRTCEIDGVTSFKCKLCNDTYTEIDYATGHEYVSEVTQEKTCTIDGKKEFTCSLCNHSYIETEKASGHVKGEYKIISEPIDNKAGIKQASCEICNEVLEEIEFYKTPYSENGKLSVSGRDLVNQYGEKFQLYGLSTHGLQWFSKVVNYDTISAIHSEFKNNVIRFALYTDENGYCDGSATVKQKMLNTLMKGIDIATELGLYVIVDWHMVGAENVLDKNPLTYLEESKEFFSYISEYYKDQDNILYEIMNEPNGSTTWADCKKYANEVIPCIRKNTDAIVLVGNPKWTADLNSVMKDPLTGFENIMYTYHFYAADHSNTTQVSTAYDKGFPVFISEFGFMESSGDGSISETNGNKWKQVLDSRNISYVAWNISNSKGSASIFKYNTSNLSDVSDSNLKEWGVYLKNWYKTKTSNTSNENTNKGGYDETITKVDFQLVIEVEEETGYLQCFINTPGFNTSRLTYNWTSTNESVLTVSEYSTITIVGDGKCSIICKSKTGSAVAVLDIDVINGEIANYKSRE